MLYLYVDGLRVATQTDNTTATSGSDESIRTYIGANEQNSGTNPEAIMEGAIDQVRVYNYARTPAQIAWEYSKGAPIAYYKFDECSGTTAYNSTMTFDDAAAGNDGTIVIGSGGGEDTVGTCDTSSTAWGSGATGKRGASLDFDGTDDYVWMADDNKFSFTNGSGTDRPFSVSAWIKMDDATNFRLVEKFGSSDSVREWALLTNASDLLTFTVRDSGGDPLIRRYNTALTGYQSTWTHILGTYDGTAVIGGLKLYLNGVRVDDTDSSTGTYNGMSNTTQYVSIGQGSGLYANGQIDDVRIFNYALTPAQVKTDYTGGAVRFE